MRLILPAAAAAVVAIALVTVATLAAAPPSETERRAAPVGASATPVETPRPPALRRTAVDRQDRVTRAHRVRESQALDDRPLLSELPLELGPVSLDAAGLSADGRRTIVTASGPNRRTAEAAYRQALSALDDPGTAYQLRWLP